MKEKFRVQNTTFILCENGVDISQAYMTVEAE